MNKKNSYLLLQLIYASVFFLVLIGGAWIYWDGLESIFILDDMVNLQGLKDIKNSSTDKFTEIMRFTTEGIAGQLGRPVSLFSFALQANYWPHQIWHFKYVNLMIHLLNGCLIFWLLLCITRIMALPERRGFLLALLTASLWLLHPFQVSTVLYVIQRMTELSALFTVVALLIYVRSRQQFAQGLLAPTTFWILISVGIGLGGLLATLSKENGVLLILYVLVLEATVLRTLPKPRYWQMWSGVFLYLPLLALVSHFTLNFGNFLSGYWIRDFTMVERLLTETRILLDYLYKILVSGPQSYGLYHDDFTISRSLLEPATTLLAVGFIILMFISALFLRKKYPIFSLGVLWFLAGHVLESSFIGLELYFEHRNYLPMLGVLFAVIYGILWMIDRMQITYLRRAIIFSSVLYLSIFPIDTWLQTGLWNKPYSQAIVWAEQHPKSRKALIQAAELSLFVGETQAFLIYYQQMVKVFPRDLGPHAILLRGICEEPDIPLPDMPAMLHRFQTSKGDFSTLISFKIILEQKALGKCSRLSSETLNSLFKAITESSAFGFREKAYHLYALFYMTEKRYADAIRMINKTISMSPKNFKLRLQKLSLLHMEERYEEMLDEIAKMRTLLDIISSPLYVEQLNMVEKLTQNKLQLRQQE